MLPSLEIFPDRAKRKSVLVNDAVKIVKIRPT
jgi:hypothetical protein